MDPTIFSIFFSQRSSLKTLSAAARLRKRSARCFRGRNYRGSKLPHRVFDLSSQLEHRLNGEISNPFCFFTHMRIPG